MTAAKLHTGTSTLPSALSPAAVNIPPTSSTVLIIIVGAYPNSMACVAFPMWCISWSRLLNLGVMRWIMFGVTVLMSASALR